MNEILLYDFELDENCYKVRLLLSALGVAYRKIAVNMFPGNEHTEPPLLALNPRGSLPILVDGDAVLSEAEAILCYLARAHDGAGTWLPADPKAFGVVMTWLQFAARDLDTASRARRHAMFDEPADQAALAAAVRRAFRLMDDHMTAREFDDAQWFVGAAPSLADLALFPAIALSRDFGVDHEAYPALRRWMRRLRTIPGFMTMPGIPDYH
ncbi:glutathione S-transferase family protein [Bradyrhizobium prioriisuperbiae]|uniref:glutathione S-transferase family protein n=1 Tax=Bradyrhizobium prioriisuperbiae TaxID=2854389 RepID=UPI0028E6B011|nr:glutathione S-transferase family protein [Bradyrhizobium prioritasuperba]